MRRVLCCHHYSGHFFLLGPCIYCMLVNGRGHRHLFSSREKLCIKNFRASAIDNWHCRKLYRFEFHTSKILRYKIDCRTKDIYINNNVITYIVLIITFDDNISRSYNKQVWPSDHDVERIQKSSKRFLHLRLSICWLLFTCDTWLPLFVGFILGGFHLTKL